MQTTTFNHVLLVLFFFTAVSACTKYGTDVPINAEMKAAYNFKVGTYWIYKDSTTGQMDSFYVVSNKASVYSTTPHNANESKHYEIIGIEVSQRSLPGYKADTTYNWKIGMAENKFDLEYYGIYGAPSQYYKNPLLYYPLTGNKYFFDYDVNGSTYHDVILIKPADSVINSIYSYSYRDELYLCPHVGFVKMKLSHPVEGPIKLDTCYRNWELVRSKIVL
jgi:hypothetical protein